MWGKEIKAPSQYENAWSMVIHARYLDRYFSLNPSDQSCTLKVLPETLGEPVICIIPSHNIPNTDQHYGFKL